MKNSIRCIYCFAFLIIEKFIKFIVNLFLINQDNQNNQNNQNNYYDYVFIKIDGIGDWLYFENIFKEIYLSNEKNNYKILFIFSSRVKNLLKKYEYKKNIQYLFVNEIALTKLRVKELINYLKKCYFIKTKRCINLVFWSKFNWSNFFFRNIYAEKYISYELFDDLLPNLIKNLSLHIPKKVKKPFKDKIFENFDNYPLPVKGLYNELLNQINFLVPNIKVNEKYKNYSKLSHYSAEKDIAIFPFSSAKERSLTPNILQKLIYILDGSGFKVDIFYGTGDKTKIEKLKGHKFSKNYKKIKYIDNFDLKKLPTFLENYKLLISVESFCAHLVTISNKSPKILLVYKNHKINNTIDEYWRWRQCDKIVSSIFLSRAGSNNNTQIDLIVNETFKILNQI